MNGIIITEDGYFNRVPILRKETMEIISKGLRVPCIYCGENHLEYTCDKQIDHLKKLINDERVIK